MPLTLYHIVFLSTAHNEPTFAAILGGAAPSRHTVGTRGTRQRWEGRGRSV